MRQIVLDTETTGLSPTEGHRIIEIAGIELNNRRLTGRHFHKYLHPGRDIDPEAQKVHGITLAFLQDKPSFSDIVEELIAFIDGAELVIHNASFDVGFLNHEFNLLARSYGPIAKHCTVLDTLALARHLHPGQRNNLDALCKRYNIDNSNRELHGALIDADLLAMTYLAMTSGQENLFIEAENASEEKITENVSETVSKVLLKDNLPIINASAIEQQAHAVVLNNIQASASSCIWLELEPFTTIGN